MRYSATKKVPGGKLLRVKVEAEGTIEELKLEGDFFLHPEDALPEIEASVIGLPYEATKEELVEKLEAAIGHTKAAFIGVTAQDIAETVQQALKTGAEAIV